MNEPLRILMLTHHRRFKVRFRSHAMARCLAERGHEVCEVCIADTRRAGIVESEWDGVRLLETPDLLWGRGRSGWDPWDMVNRLAYFNRERQSFDLIHCFETRPVTIYPALAYQRQHAIPIITDWVDWWGRGGIIDELRPRWYRLLFGGLETYYEEAFRTAADGLTVISSALAERARKLGVPDERICHVPGGTFAEEFPRHSREECRRHVGLPESIPILAFSSLDSFLDIEFIMQAFRLVVEKYPNALLLVTGKTPADVAILAERYQVQGNVRLTGFVPFEELSWYLGCADVFVLPAHRGKGVARAMLEALHAHPDLQGLRRWALFTRDMQPFYAKLGWEAYPNPERLMAILRGNLCPAP